MKAQVQEAVKQEVEKVGAGGQGCASEEADALIKEAEAEVARAGRSQKAGDALVAEADAQGKKLVADAGGNPVKQAAANRMARELNSQAQKKSEALQAEAAVQAATLLENARKKADALVP
ncbi:MAG: hypothetical protein R2751_16945 [Bacteroidales bacterium]